MRDNYTFDGWYTASTGGTKVTASTIVTSSHTLYAHWTANTRTVTFDSQGGSSVSSQTVNYNAKATKPTDPTKTGYTFGGWYKEEACTNAWNFSSDTVDDDITLYAKWTTDSYSISYNLGGGSVSGTNPTSYNIETAAFTLKNPTRTGYTFKGWSGTGLSGDTNTTVSVAKGSTGNRTYTANWTANTYTVTLNNQSATTAGTASVTATYGSAMPSITKPTKTGYTFGGYYTETNGGGTQYYTSTGASARNWDKTSATTLYAKWTANTYTVTLNKNNGTGGTASVTATYGSAMPSATMPTRTGYTFAGYYDTNAATGGTQYYTASGASARNWNKTSDTTLYARWTANTNTSYTVEHYQQNTAKNGYVLAHTDHLTGISDSKVTPAVKSYTGFTAPSTQEITIAPDGSTVLKYYYTRNDYSITLNTNGGTINAGNVTEYTYGVGAALPTDVTRSGYTFDGWYATSTFTGSAVTTISESVSGDKTYYAKWLTNLTASNLSLSTDSVVYDGNARTPVIRFNDSTLIKDTDYTCTYKNSSGTTVPAMINVGTYTVVVTGKGNYSTPTSVELSYHITKKTVTITNLSAKDKFYDGSTAAQLNGTPQLSGAVTGEAVSLDISEVTGNFADKNVGNGKTVTFTGFSLSGTESVLANYNLSVPPTVTASITAKPVTATVTAVDRAYEPGVRTVALTAGTVSGVVDGDTVTVDISAAIGTMSDDSAGTDKSVSVTGVTLGGADAGNYELSAQPAGVTVNIAAMGIAPTLTLEYTETEYDRTAKQPAVTVKNGENVIPSDQYSVEYFNNTNAGTATVTVTCKSGVNYSFSTLQAQFTIT
ncbi:MAG: InlB B-repeat-containing protein [Ruminiclostridium sp.]|nr:InlB B-repeat-containing protein [Ruminiclostridium sp.]